MEWTAQFLLDSMLQFLLSRFLREHAQVFARERERDVRPNFLPWCPALLGDERRAQNCMPAHDPVKAGFENTHVQGANTIEQRLKPVAVESRMQFFEEPDLLLGKRKRKRLRMWLDVDRAGDARYPARCDSHPQ